MLATGRLQGMPDQQSESVPLNDRLDLHPNLNPPRQRGIRRTFKSLGQTWMPDQPDANQVARIEGKVEECWEVTKEFHWQVLRLIDNPHWQQLFAIDHFVDALLDVAPKLGSSVGRCNAKRSGQAPIQIEPSEISLGLVNYLITMRIQSLSEAAKRGRLAHTGLAGDEPDPGGLQQPVKALGQLGQCAIVPQLGEFLTQRRMAQSEVLSVHVISPSGRGIYDAPTPPD